MKTKEWKCCPGHVKGHANGSLTVMVKIPATSVLTYTRLAQENNDGCLSAFVQESSEMFVRDFLREEKESMDAALKAQQEESAKKVEELNENVESEKL